jgi:hypothetical protein
VKSAVNHPLQLLTSHNTKKHEVIIHGDIDHNTWWGS